MPGNDGNLSISSIPDTNPNTNIKIKTVYTTSIKNFNGEINIDSSNNEEYIFIAVPSFIFDIAPNENVQYFKDGDTGF